MSKFLEKMAKSPVFVYAVLILSDRYVIGSQRFLYIADLRIKINQKTPPVKKLTPLTSDSYFSHMSHGINVSLFHQVSYYLLQSMTFEREK